MVESSDWGSTRAQALVFVGGPPGVGKTTACELLYRRLANSIHVDADDLWCRMNPFRVDAVTVGMVERDVAAVLRNCLWSTSGNGLEHPVRHGGGDAAERADEGRA